jgi:transketolase
LNNDDHLVYTLHGDGELQEGQNWEAIMYASKKVDNHCYNRFKRKTN